MKEKKATFSVVTGLILFLAVVLVLTATGWARSGGDIANRPEVFDGQGRIDRMGTWEIVINDRLYGFEAGTIFYSEDGRAIGSGSFSKGMRAGFMLKQDRKRVLKEIWKLKPLK